MFRGIRKYIILLNILSIFLVILFIKLNYSDQSELQIIRFTQTTALFATIFLYLTLLVSPLTKIFTTIPFRNQLIQSRQSLGLSSFSYAALHAISAFFFQLGGIVGLQYLKSNYLLAVIFAFVSLMILTTLAITSAQAIAKKCGRYWKSIHRFIYLASFLIIIHALMLGTHTRNLSNLVPLVSFLLIIILLVLESIRIDAFLTQKYQTKNKNIALIITCILITILVATNFDIFPVNPLSVHK